MAQYYSALPFNITSGVTTVQGTAGRPLVNGAFIPRNAGVGDDFLGVSLRVSRAVKVKGALVGEAAVEAFNLVNRRNDLTRNGNFGSGAYPPSHRHIRPDHRRRRSPLGAAGVSSEVLMSHGSPSP
jgi:hypothetical protein